MKNRETSETHQICEVFGACWVLFKDLLFGYFFSFFHF